MKGQCEAFAQAFVSGFCVKNDCGRSEWPHGPWTSLPLWGYGPAPKTLGSFCGKGGVPFSASGVPLKEGLQSRSLGTGDWKTRPLVRIGGLGAWQAP